MYKWLLILIALAGAVSTRAQEGYHYTDYPRSLLWEVKGNGITRPVYVFGTIHHICNKWVYWTPGIDSLLHSVDKVYFEIDLAKLHKMYYLEEEVSGLDTLQPSVSKIVAGIRAGQVSCVAEIGYETIIYTKAVNAGIATAGLESISSQIFLLDKIYDDRITIEQAGTLNAFGRMYHQLLQGYAEQDINSLYRLTSIQMSFEQSRQLLDDRNKRWVLKFNQLVKDKSVFIAVGAAHLGGKSGVLNLLQSKGYTVTPVDYKIQRD